MSTQNMILSTTKNFIPGEPAPRGSKLNTKGWLQEAALRMLLNNLDKEVAENPAELVVYGGRGKAARSHSDFKNITKALQELESDESLLIQSGSPVARIKTWSHSPRVLIANSNLVGNWAHWEHFDDLEKKGLMMYGQMTAGSWIYIGSQGIVQGTYETFYEAFQQHYNGETKGKFVFSSGLGGMGGAQPLAAVLTGACFLGIEVDRSRAEMRLKSKYLDEIYDDIPAAMEALKSSLIEGKARSIALIGNAVDLLPKLLERADFKPSLVTDQTSSHDPTYGYVPQGYSMEQVIHERKANPKKVEQDALKSIGKHLKCLLELKSRGIPTFDYGNNIRAMAKKVGVENAFDIKGFVPEYIRPLFCKGKGPFRFIMLSGEAEDLKKADQALLNLFPNHKDIQRWLSVAPKRISIQGLPARILWLGYGDRLKAGLLLNQMVKTKEISCPVVIGRDHLDCGSVASPYRETESMADGSDAVADWALLNAFGNISSGASWVSFHHGGGVGMGYSLHAGMVIVADGTAEAAERLKRVLTFDPAMGIFRHADAGYDISQKIAEEHMSRAVEPDSPHFYPRNLSQAEVNHGGKNMVYKKE
ncbi:urocanate hydratase [Silvanigrella aquatica]|uniref:Urocanate hydratase n=1 Tax=Silvanigrella aquatica TaxID=1915309 RepID=A0A1L4D2F9_9BACT|nr:urocanate hydratase [Silvanigrella aquatica]APJ04380.1 urocanate hydratase [Silvanigrella aquatica]